MFDIILFILKVAAIIFFVTIIIRWRFKITLNSSLKLEARRVPKLSDKTLQKRIRQAEKFMKINF